MTKTEANCRMRGEILRLVRKMGTNGISYEGMERIFLRAGRMGVAADMEEHLQYLADKGYLTKELLKDEISGVKRWMAFITAKGIDLLDEVIERDPGVEIVC